jgi:hypothetical protein
LNAAAVAIVKIDHHKTILVSTRRVPVRSPHKPVGISKAAYASVKALKTKLICSVVKERSRIICGATIEMQTRSR